MIYIVEKSFYIKVNDIVQILALCQRVGDSYGIFLTPVRTKSKTSVMKFCFTYWF